MKTKHRPTEGPKIADSLFTYLMRFLKALKYQAATLENPSLAIAGADSLASLFNMLLQQMAQCQKFIGKQLHSAYDAWATFASRPLVSMLLTTFYLSGLVTALMSYRYAMMAGLITITSPPLAITVSAIWFFMQAAELLDILSKLADIDWSATSFRKLITSPTHNLLSTLDAEQPRGEPNTTQAAHEKVQSNEIASPEEEAAAKAVIAATPEAAEAPAPAPAPAAA
jgi:hypothetical protein